MDQLIQNQELFKKKGCQVLMVTFESWEKARLFRKIKGLTIPILLDPHRELYHYYGFKKGKFRDIWTFSGIWRFLKNRLKPSTVKPSTLEEKFGEGQDIYQLGGDVILDKAGQGRWVWASQTPEDRPSLDQILSILDSL